MKNVLPLSLFCLVVATGCNPAPVGLTVDVRTDYHPGVDFVRVVTTLTRAGEGFGGEVREETYIVEGTEDFLFGVRVAELSHATTGAVFVDVRLTDGAGRTVASRRLAIELTRSYAALVLLTSNCAGVECPIPSGSAALTECLDAECIDPACSELMPELCPDACAVDSDCSVDVGCTTRQCIEGTCFCADEPSLPDGGVDTGACECMPGATEDRTMPCGNCDTGTQTDTRTCDADCVWGDFVEGTCAGATGCTPGSTRPCANGDPCGERVCRANCTLTGCQRQPGAECLRIAPGGTTIGTNYRCCGTYMWQYCITGCVWSGACTSCDPTVGCPDCG